MLDRLSAFLSHRGLLGCVDFYVSDKTSRGPVTDCAGDIARHCSWLVRSFWTAWFDFDHVNLHHSRRACKQRSLYCAGIYSDRQSWPGRPRAPIRHHQVYKWKEHLYSPRVHSILYLARMQEPRWPKPLLLRYSLKADWRFRRRSSDSALLTDTVSHDVIQHAQRCFGLYTRLLAFPGPFRYVFRYERLKHEICRSGTEAATVSSISILVSAQACPVK